MLVTLSQDCFWFDINALEVLNIWADEALQSHLAQLVYILKRPIYPSFLFSLIRQMCNCRHYIKDSGFYLKFSNERPWKQKVSLIFCELCSLAIWKLTCEWLKIWLLTNLPNPLRHRWVSSNVSTCSILGLQEPCVDEYNWCTCRRGTDSPFLTAGLLRAANNVDKVLKWQQMLYYTQHT